MDIQIQRAAEALDQGDHACLGRLAGKSSRVSSLIRAIASTICRQAASATTRTPLYVV